MKYEIAIFRHYDVSQPIREIICEKEEFPRVYFRLKRKYKKELKEARYHFEIYKGVDLMEMFKIYFGPDGVLWHKQVYLRLVYEEDIEKEIRKIQAESKQKTR